MNPPSISPFQHQGEHSGEGLRSCGKAETEQMELEKLPIQGDSKVESRVQMG